MMGNKKKIAVAMGILMGISGSFFAAAAFDCNEFERRVLLELLIASKEAIRKNKRFLRYEDVK